MIVRTAILGIALVGCKSTESTDPAAVEETDTGTSDTDTTGGSTVTADGITATCSPATDNSLRFNCEVTLETAGAVAIEFSEADGPVRTRTSEDGVATSHKITLWGMRPQTEHAWTVVVDDVAGPAGTVTTGTLPSSLDDLEVSISGADPVVEHVTFASGCGQESFALIIGADGEVYWYEAFASNGIGMNYTEDGTVVAQSSTKIVEIDMAGNLLLELDRGQDFSAPLHHDIYKYDGHIYALFADSYPVGNEDAVVDGIYVFDDGGTLVETWELFEQISISQGDLSDSDDRFWSTEFPGALDFSHGNSVFVDDSGIYLSTRWISTVWKIAGLGEPDFGNIDWSLTGEPSSPIDEDLRLTSAIGGDVNFIGQHHATIAPDGTLTLFDNRNPGDVSRGLAVSIDANGGTAEIIAAYDLPEQCGIQGGSYQMANGDTIVTCATTGTTYHFRDGESSAGFAMEATCGAQGGPGGGGRPETARVQPVDL